MKNVKLKIQHLWYSLQMGFYTFRHPEYFQHGLYKLVEMQFKVIEETQKQNRPMLQHIGFVNPTDKSIHNIYTIWVGIGDGTPLQRLEQLAKENIELKNHIKALVDQSESTTNS